MMAPTKLYTAKDFGGSFLDSLLEHFRQKQKAGEDLDLHLQAGNPEDKVSLHQVKNHSIYWQILLDGTLYSV